jgi:hypothetical protein
MANNAHFINASQGSPTIVVRDDRGASVVELELPATMRDTAPVDDELRAAGWTRTAEWSTADDGWIAPVVPS